MFVNMLLPVYAKDYLWEEDVNCSQRKEPRIGKGALIRFLLIIQCFLSPENVNHLKSSPFENS